MAKIVEIWRSNPRNVASKQFGRLHIIKRVVVLVGVQQETFAGRLSAGSSRSLDGLCLGDVLHLEDVNVVFGGESPKK